MTYILKNLTCISVLLLTLGYSLPAMSSEVQNSAEELDVQKELWSGNMYSSTFKAGVCIDNKGNVNGVLFLRLKNGKISTYTYSGTKNSENKLSLRHHSGHTFNGKLESDTVVSGKVKTKNGYTVKLKGKRTLNAPLGPRCQPLSI